MAELKRWANFMSTPEKPKTKAKKADTPKDICFTIMPFGGWFDDYYDSIFRPAIDDAGLCPKRADDLYRPSTIVNDIWAYTRSAKLILADLTGKNPNVFYELGLAHALAKPAILVAESMNDVPFDLRALRVIEYDKNEPNWGDALQERITKSIKEVIAAPLASVLPAFLDVKAEPENRTISEKDKAIIELRQDLELVKRELRGRVDGLPERMPAEMRLKDSREALELLRRMQSARMPAELIVRHLVERGAPEEWVRREIAVRKKK